MATEFNLRKRIKFWIILFVIGLIVSGITAFPIEVELRLLVNNMGFLPDSIQQWLRQVSLAMSESNGKYPFLAYGTDWLAFAHIVIAIAFIGPLKDPIKNIWVIEFGMIACVLIIPTAFIAGAIREIPFYWQLVDCSFGVIGLIPLIIAHVNITKLKKRISPFL